MPHIVNADCEIVYSLKSATVGEKGAVKKRL